MAAPRPSDDRALARRRVPPAGRDDERLGSAPEARGLRISVHDDGEASLTPLPGARVTVAGLRHHLDDLDHRGVHRVTTSALSPRDAAVWEAAGFVARTSLVLLRADLRAGPARHRRSPATVPRRHAGRRSDWPELAALDTAAFAPQPGLGTAGLLDAMAVTPAARVRVAGRPALGFVLAGHDVRCGYLQRLAVAPWAAGQGIGSALVLDTLRWMRRHGAREALVNTEQGNERALALYERHGFVRQDEGLVVMEHRP